MNTKKEVVNFALEAIKRHDKLAANMLSKNVFKVEPDKLVTMDELYDILLPSKDEDSNGTIESIDTLSKKIEELQKIIDGQTTLLHKYAEDEKNGVNKGEQSKLNHCQECDIKDKLEHAFKAGRIFDNTTFELWYETFVKSLLM